MVIKSREWGARSVKAYFLSNATFYSITNIGYITMDIWFHWKYHNIHIYEYMHVMYMWYPFGQFIISEWQRVCWFGSFASLLAILREIVWTNFNEICKIGRTYWNSFPLETDFSFTDCKTDCIGCNLFQHMDFTYDQNFWMKSEWISIRNCSANTFHAVLN